MKASYIAIIVILVVLLLASAGFVLLWPQQEAREPGFVYLDGTVTAYSVTPTYTDGPILFKIDGKSVDIGGGLRPSDLEASRGEIYHPIQVGDKVAAKLKKNDSGYLTIYDCPRCYIHKQ